MKKDRIDEYDAYTTLEWNEEKLSLVLIMLDKDNLTESDRKKLHDSFLEKHGINKEKVFKWGKVESTVDIKSGFPFIGISFF